MPDVPKDSVTGGVVDDNGTVGAEIAANEQVGQHVDLEQTGSWSKASGWKLGAWIKASWGGSK